MVDHCCRGSNTLESFSVQVSFKFASRFTITLLGGGFTLVLVCAYAFFGGFPSSKG